jgi:hypothetical protein
MHLTHDELETMSNAAPCVSPSAPIGVYTGDYRVRDAGDLPEGCALIENAGSTDHEDEMTNAQVLTAAIAIIVPILMLLDSNSRIVDARVTLRNELTATRVEQRDRFKELINQVRCMRQALTALNGPTRTIDEQR